MKADNNNMNIIELTSSAGTIKVKPMKKKELNRLAELLETITNSIIIRDEVERDCLVDSIDKRFLTPIDRSAFYCIPTEQELFQVVKNWRDYSNDYHACKELTTQLGLEPSSEAS